MPTVKTALTFIDLSSAATNVMKHLETKREAAERKRVSLMSKGIADFLEKTSRVTENDLDPLGDIKNVVPTGRRQPKRTKEKYRSNLDNESNDSPALSDDDEAQSEKTLDKIKVTLDHAASILRESLELTVGGVVFLDMALGYKQSGVADAYFDIRTDLGAEVADQKARINGEERPVLETNTQRINGQVQERSSRTGMSPDQVRGFEDHISPARVLAMSSAKITEWKPSENVLDAKTLQTFINTYPQGNVWYIDDEGYFSSLDQANEAASTGSNQISGKARSRSQHDITRQQAEASLLLKVFAGARQIIFVPLWDAGGNRWHSGCFVWSRSAVPVFTVESEVSFLSAFTNSVMVEISRLDAITANKMKSDFISSISHEFRSPLHGILASADFLRESELEPSQIEFVSTIQNCGSTLLDTINHVLDYSKINSFEKSGDHGTISNELLQVSNIALLTEEIINGMIAASEYQHAHLSSTTSHSGTARSLASKKRDEHPIEVIVDIESRDWDFVVQPGAIRRIIMNIFGNAQKYTASGFILVQLRVRDVDTKRPLLALNIVDSGRGMSREYMERKLYTPFAQEDTFATGVGLGLSIVWSIVNQLGGKIQVRSEVGKGTDVEVLLPLGSETKEQLPDQTSSGKEAAYNVEQVRSLSTGKTIAIRRNTHQTNHDKRNKSLAWDCLERYCRDWFGFQVTSSPDSNTMTNADIVITEREDISFDDFNAPFAIEVPKMLLIRDNWSRHEDLKVNQSGKGEENIWTPIGPYKLARGLLSLFKQHENRTNSTSLLDQTQHHNQVSKKPKQISTVVQAEEVPDMLKLNLSSNAATTQPTSMKATSTSVSLRLLAVDDNDLNLQLLARYLKKRKQDVVVTAKDGLEALNAVKNLYSDSNGEQTFDIIFMDISMPVMDGFESTVEIRNFERACAASWKSFGGDSEWPGKSCIVALTGLGSRRDRDRAVACGVDEFMTKPVNFKDVGELIKRICKKRDSDGWTR